MKFALLLGMFLLPACAFAESIDSFSSDIYLNTDGTFNVTEEIEYDFGAQDRHGIFRFIETTHPQEASSNWKDRYVDLDIVSVSMDGSSVPFEITEGGGSVGVKIGDPDRTITGVHTYGIDYIVRGGYSYFEDGSAEIYWNATGNGWEVSIATTTVTLYGPGGIFVDQNACYKGRYGESKPCDSILRNEDSSVTFTALDLNPYEGVTIAQELNGPQLQVLVLERSKWWLIGLIIFPILIIGSIFAGYRYRTANRTGRPIIAQYEPYENFKPMYSGMLLDGRLDPQDIAAGIVYLAEQGFLKIRKTERKVLFLIEVDDYEVELVRPTAEIESIFLRDVVELIFSSSAGVGSTMALSKLQKDTVKQQKNARLLQDLRSDLKKDMRKEGFYEVNSLFFKALIAEVVILVFVFVVGGFIVPELLIICIVVGVLISLALGLFYERRTRKGYEAVDHLKGFKLFLSVTDTERFKFHNAPQKSPEQFMEYLPYAIAFGVEKQWAEVFKDITIPDPTWYDGGSAGHFSAVGLTNSLGSFSTAMAASSVSSASSSGGSGGGGFSGGGGGGGGGGSW